MTATERQIAFDPIQETLTFELGGFDLSIFPQSTHKLIAEVAQLPHVFTEAIKLIKNVVLDDGLNRFISVELRGPIYDPSRRQIERESYNRVLTHLPVQALNRQSFIQDTFHDIPDVEKAKNIKLSFIKLDVKDFRAIDRVGCQNSTHIECLRRQRTHQTMADFSNNEIYEKVGGIIKKINDIYKHDGKQTKLIFGRIGGDEIGISVIGAQNIEEIIEIYKEIVDEQNGVQSIESYFSREGRTIKDKISINTDSKIIYFGNDIDEAKKINITKLGLGFVQGGETEFEMLKKYGRLPEDNSHSNVSVRLPKRLEETANRLQNHYPTFVDRARGFYGDLSDLFGHNTELDILLGEFFERFVKDQMTGSPATNFRVYMTRALELMKRTQNNSISNFTFDLQGPKEMNGFLSYDATDMAVNSLVVKIFDAFNLGRVDLHKYLNICVGRLSTKVYVTIGLKEGINRKNLNTAINRLNQIYSTELVEVIDGKETETKIKVAKSVRVGNIPEEDFRLDARKSIEDAKDDFYRRFLLKLITFPGDREELLRKSTH